MRDALFVVDGYGLIYRSYFAFIRNPLFNPQGKNASAIFGFFRSLFMLLKEHQPARLAVALDSAVPTFRHEKYPEYKATRERTPGDLKDEIPVIEEILAALGIPTIRVNGFEADDVMATLATRAREADKDCVIVSSDKDLLQLAEGTVTVLKPDSGGFMKVDHDRVVELWQVRPDQILDYLSLVGDSSDNVPGVKGIGAKTAASLLESFGTLDGIYANLDRVKSSSQRSKLEEGRDSAYLSRELITLATNVPLAVTEDDLAIRELNPVAAHYFAAEGMKSLVHELIGESQLGEMDTELAARVKQAASRDLGRPAGTAPTGPAGTGPAADKSGDHPATLAPSGRLEAPEPPSQAVAERSASIGYAPDPRNAEPGRYELITTPDDLEQWCAEARKAGIVSFDCETTSLDAMKAEPVGFSLSVAGGAACYVALHGPDGPVCDAETARDRLRALLEDPHVRVIGQNLKYDYKVLSRWGVQIANPWFDTMVAAWLLDSEGKSFSMDTLAEHYLDYTTVHYDEVVPSSGKDEPEHTFDEVELEEACRYAAEDADITYRLHEVLSPLLKERGFEKLFFDVEMRLLPILASMEMEGIRVDVTVLQAYGEELADELSRTEEEIYKLCGHEFNIGSTKQLQEVLFEERKLSPTKRTKTGFSTDTSVLQELAAEDPVPALVLRHRLLAKLKSTYVDALPRLVNPGTGRIHTHYNLTGTATGRLSSTDPNLQNIPIRDEEGRRIRGAFIPRDGWRFVSADYSQVELVVLAHLSGDPGLASAFADGVDVHRHTGSLIFGVPGDQVTSQQRRVAKTINFGVMYGMSAFRLARELQISRTEARQFIDTYFSTYSQIKSFIDATVADAEKNGYVTTLLGRKRYLPNITNRNKTVKMASERIAVNTPIQGSAADIMKLAMIRLERALEEKGLKCKMLLQVHDELIFECPPEEVTIVTDLVRAEMTAAMELSIPLQVSVESGSSWGEFH
jgi:DNA polymerase-1